MTHGFSTLKRTVKIEFELKNEIGNSLVIALLRSRAKITDIFTLRIRVFVMITCIHSFALYFIMHITKYLTTLYCVVQLSRVTK